MVAVDVLLGRQSRRAADRRGAVHRRCEQSGAELLSGQPGAGAGPADGRRAEHGRRGQGRRAWSSICAKLAERLPVTFVPVQANQRIGIAELKRGACRAGGRSGRQARIASPFPPQFHRGGRKLAVEVRSSGGMPVCRGISSSGCCWIRVAIWRRQRSAWRRRRLAERSSGGSRAAGGGRLAGAGGGIDRPLWLGGADAGGRRHAARRAAGDGQRPDRSLC